MKQFKALVKKEVITYRGRLLAPIWVTLGFYGVTLLGVIFNLIKYGEIRIINGFMPTFTQVQLDMFNWYACAGAVSLLGMITMAVGFGMSDGLINGDRRKRCEIFHLSQPVSLIKSLFAKFTTLYATPMLVLLGLAIVNSLVISSVMTATMGSGFWIGVAGGMIAWVGVLFSYMFAVSLTWFFASVFKHQSFLIGLLTVSGIEVSIHLLNFLVGWHIPSLWGYLVKMINLTAVSVSIGDTVVQSAHLISKGFGSILNWDNLLRVVYSAVLLCSSWFFIKNREVS